MAKKNRPLGKLLAVHPLAPEHIQRAVFIAVLSFVFFLAMMVVFYIRENVLYFLLASAFLVVYIVTLLSWIVQRRSVVNIYENGLNYKKRTALWSEVETVNEGRDVAELIVRGEKPIVLPRTLSDFERLLLNIRGRI